MSKLKEFGVNVAKVLIGGTAFCLAMLFIMLVGIELALAGHALLGATLALVMVGIVIAALETWF